VPSLSCDQSWLHTRTEWPFSAQIPRSVPAPVVILASTKLYCGQNAQLMFNLGGLLVSWLLANTMLNAVFCLFAGCICPTSLYAVLLMLGNQGLQACTCPVMHHLVHHLQKKRFDGATYNAGGSSYQMQWNVAEGYDIAYQEPGPGSVAIAETMNQVQHCPSLHCYSSGSTCDSHHASSLQNQYKMQ